MFKVIEIFGESANTIHQFFDAMDEEAEEGQDFSELRVQEEVSIG